LTSKGTGCIFHYDEAFPEGSGKGFKESDTPNFMGSYYSYTKVGFVGAWRWLGWTGLVDWVGALGGWVGQLGGGVGGCLSR